MINILVLHMDVSEPSDTPIGPLHRPYGYGTFRVNLSRYNCLMKRLDMGN